MIVEVVQNHGFELAVAFLVGLDVTGSVIWTESAEFEFDNVPDAPEVPEDPEVPGVPKDPDVPDAGASVVALAPVNYNRMKLNHWLNNVYFNY